jgi:hypothetical protein
MSVQGSVQVEAAVVALAGRRVDAVDTDPPRFPLQNVPLVRKRLSEMFKAESASALVCSASCGADLLALEAGEQLGVRRRIVLPFSPERFRETSVVDRPGDWGQLFDRLVATARAVGDLIVLGDQEGDAAYAAANEAIVREACAITLSGSPRRLVAVVVWEGAARAGNDATESFRSLAATAGFEARSVLTL